MPRYYFELSDGERIVDPEGMVFDDLTAAKKQAVQTLAELVAEDIVEGRGIDLNTQLTIVESGSASQAVVRLGDFLRS